MSIEQVVHSLEQVIAAREQELVGLRANLEQLRACSRNGKPPALPTTSTATVTTGQWQGLKPWQAIREYLKMRGNPGVSQCEIAEALVKEGAVLRGKKYPKRSVSLAVENKRDYFEKRDGLIYLNSAVR